MEKNPFHYVLAIISSEASKTAHDCRISACERAPQLFATSDLMTTEDVFVCTTLLYLSALLSCIYCSSVAFRALLSRLPDGGNLITSLYPQPHSASSDNSELMYFYILFNVSGRMDQVSTVEKGSEAYIFCVCKCVYFKFVQCGGILCCR